MNRNRRGLLPKLLTVKTILDKIFPCENYAWNCSSNKNAVTRRQPAARVLLMAKPALRLWPLQWRHFRRALAMC